MSPTTAIVVLGGGPSPTLTSPLPFVLPRYLAALSLYKTSPHTSKILCLSAGTAHVQPLTSCSYPIFESTVCGHFMLSNNIPPSDVLVDTFSYDTIGNAYYARNVVENLGSIIITSRFHIERSKEIFDWVWGLKSGKNSKLDLEYNSVEDIGLTDSDLAGRVEKELKGLRGFEKVKRKVEESYNNNIDAWMFTEHDLYSSEGLAKRAKGGCDYCSGYGGMTSYGGGGTCGGNESSNFSLVVFGVIIGACLSEFWKRRKFKSKNKNKNGFV
ncbi:hypothetical protein TL16_g02919 [Triparma laevis f. inornata]|uniref:DUF218 domain-containing protein n=1 Tax=Triparma laevis f. inornata TaxID=1714386 RepID=A0A9W7DZL1_9STRA|nr:hypothetical protein TL16_g02919 [Triparma laevis f. inornata]